MCQRSLSGLKIPVSWYQLLKNTLKQQQRFQKSRLKILEKYNCASIFFQLVKDPTRPLDRARESIIYKDYRLEELK